MRKMKEELKQLAIQIRESKFQFKDKQRQNLLSWKDYSSLYDLRCSFRHKHIAYCLLRGKTYEQIENKCSEDNKPNMEIVYKIMEEYKNENVCVSA